MKFRPCIDLHKGCVVQLVGGTLRDDGAGVQVNYTSDRRPGDYARLYKQDNLGGGHVIALGPGNHEAALEALAAFPGGLQYGGGVNPDNAMDYLEAGASHVIVTSHVFHNGRVDFDRLDRLTRVVGRNRLVLDLSCRWRDGAFWIVTDRWQQFTDQKIEPALLEQMSRYCAEYLVHGVDVEGRMQGVQEELIQLLAWYSPLPVTYAGGVTSMEDLELVRRLGREAVDVTIGSALDIFGGPVAYRRVVEWHNRLQE